MSWNWLGWLMWILGIGFLGFAIHYIRVKQLMLIAKTKKRFDSKLFTQYVVMSLVAILWLGSLVYLRFIQPVNYNDRQQVQLSTKYQPLQLHDQGNDYYYVLAKHSTSGKRPIVSYTYWADNSKYMVSSRFSSISDGARLIPVEATSLPWNKEKLQKIDNESGHAFAAVMTGHYRNTPLNGLSLRANHVASSYTLLRVPQENMVAEH